jgi:hypothetical protein
MEGWEGMGLLIPTVSPKGSFPFTTPSKEVLVTYIGATKG